jgi:predicted porin
MSRARRAIFALAALMAAAPAAAQTVTVYGRLFPEVVWVRMTGSTQPGTDVSTLAQPPTGETFDNNVQMDSSNSRLGFRGEEPLGAGLKAFFQIEQRIQVDTGGTQLASRDTFVGLQSDRFGTVKMGGFDTVYKEIGDTLSFLGVSSGNFVSNSNVLSKQGFGDSSAGSFHLRRANSTRYESPEWSGLQAMVQYSPDEAETSSRNAWLLSLGVRYENGPFYGALAYEIHNDTFGGSRNVPSALSNTSNPNARARDTGIRATLQYRFGEHTVEGNVAQMEYKERGGQPGHFERYRHLAYSLGLDSRWGSAWRTAAAFAYASAGSCKLFDGVPCSTSGLDGRQLSLGAAYYLSKRTYLFALYAKLWNGRSAQYNNVDGVDVPPGADPQQFALGIAHNF